MAITKEPVIEFTIGTEKVEVNFNLMDCEMRDLLEDKILDIKKRQSIYFKYPFEENETNEKWSERVSKEVETEYARKKGEKVEEHLKRMFDSPQDVKEMTLKIVNAIHSTFSKKPAAEVTPEQLKKCNYAKLRRFIFDVLTYCDIAANDFRPKELGK